MALFFIFDMKEKRKSISYDIFEFSQSNYNKPGTAQVGAPIKAQKEQSVWNIQRPTITKLFDYHTVSNNTGKYTLETQKQNFLRNIFFFWETFWEKITWCRKTQKESIEDLCYPERPPSVLLVGAFRRKTQTIVVTFLRPTNWQIL